MSDECNKSEQEKEADKFKKVKKKSSLSKCVTVLRYK